MRERVLRGSHPRLISDAPAGLWSNGIREILPKPPCCAKVPHPPRISAPLNSSHPGNIFKDFAPLSSAEKWHRDCSPAKRHCWAVETLACELTAPRGHYALLQTLVAAEFQSRPE